MSLKLAHLITFLTHFSHSILFIPGAQIPHVASWVLNSTEHNHNEPQLAIVERAAAERGGMYSLTELRQILETHLNNPNAVIAVFAAQNRGTTSSS